MHLDQRHTARTIGITESVASKLISGKSFKTETERTLNKFFLTLILYELWQLKPVSDIAVSFQVDRGLVQNLMGSAAIQASAILKFCEELDELWPFVELLRNLTQRLSYCCSNELLPLMQLPCVKLVMSTQAIYFNFNFTLYFLLLYFRDEPNSFLPPDTKHLKTLQRRLQRNWWRASNI